MGAGASRGGGGDGASEAAAIAAFRAPRVCARHDSAWRACRASTGDAGALQCERLRDMADVCRASVAGGAAADAAAAWNRCAAAAAASADARPARDRGSCAAEVAAVRAALRRMRVPLAGEGKVAIPGRRAAAPAAPPSGT